MRYLFVLLILALSTLTSFSQGTTSTARYQTVNELVGTTVQAVASNAYLSALVTGRVTANDGGGGLFFFVPGSVVATNTSTVFPSTGVDGRWFRVVGNYTDSLWFPTETNKYLRLPQTGQLQIGVNLGYINVSSNYPRTFQWQGFNDGQSKGIHIPDWGSGVAVGEPTAEFVVWGKGSLDAVTAGQASEALVIDSVKETSYRIKTSVGGTAGVNRPLIFLQEDTEAMKMDTSARIEIKSHLTVGSTNAGPQMMNVMGGRTYLVSAGDAFALGVGWNSSAGVYWLGGSNSATPDLLFSNGPGTNHWSMTFAGDLRGVVAGGGIELKEGSNARMGVATLVNGTVTVANTSVTATTRIFVSRVAINGSTTLGTLEGGTITPTTSFVINSYSALAVLSSDDDSIVNWLLMEPSP